jgi:hypothetical protein
MRVVYEYGARESMPPVRLTWYQGTEKPDAVKEGKLPRGFNDGVLFVGSKGMLLSNYGKHVLLPEDDFRDFKRPDQFIPPSPGQQAEWLNACKTGAPTASNFEYAGWLTEANHLGNVAYRTGKTLEWDPVKLCAPNAPESEPFIRREYRKGWSLT